MKAATYNDCPHIQVGNGKVTVVDCTMCDEKFTQWVAGQPWYTRLDEWHHQRGHDSQLWFWLWRPFCNLVDRKYRRI